MRNPRLHIGLTLVLALIGIGAGRQLAMLVEWTPLRATDNGTVTEISVQVAPEDRGALGSDVMLWVELSRQEARVLRRGWAMKIDDPNQPLRVEIVVPDGAHVLRVDLEGAAGRSKGVWWGDLDFSAPASESGSASESASESAPETESQTESVPVPVPVDSDSDGDSGSDSDSDQGQDQQPEADTAAGSATALDPAPAPAPVPEPASDTGSEQSNAAAAIAVAVAADTAPDSVGGALRPRDPDADGGRAVNDPPTDEGTTAPPYGTITIMVTRDHQPVTGLVADDFEVKIGGQPVAIDHLSGPSEGATILGVAVDLRATSSVDGGWIAGMVRSLAERATSASGRVFVMNVDGRLDLWVGPDEVASKIVAVGDSSADELPALVLSALERSDSEAGKAFLLLVTDGRGPRAGKSWGEAHRAAAAAGVPVIVAGVWNADFGSGLRKDLRKLASVSGGAVFYVQGPSQSGNLVERFGAVIEAGYSAGVTVNPGTRDVEVSLVGVDADLRSSTAVRRGAKPWILPMDGRIKGHFVYMADAAIFTECATGTRLPVAMEADYISAERAYLDDRPKPGAPLLMTIDARVDLRPGIEGDLLRDTIVIDRFIVTHPGDDCQRDGQRDNDD